MDTIKVKIIIIGSIILFISIVSGIIAGNAIAKKINCSSFQTNQEDQETFNQDTIKYKDLDRDKDGKACEALK